MGGNILKPWFQVLLIALLCILVNLNTLNNSYALDDVVVLTENKIVQKGVEGIPELVASDYFKGYNLTGAVLSSARYRPVSLILFALEYEFFGANAFVSHLVNLLLYLGLLVLLYYLLRHKIFNLPLLVPFFTIALFSVHPIHTEVIANVKSRDEILTFMLLSLSLLIYLKHSEGNIIYKTILAPFVFFIALLTKESAITFLGIIPLVVFYFRGSSIVESLKAVLPFLVAALCYFALRYSVVGFSNNEVLDITNSPYLLATKSEAFATKTFIVLKYLVLLIYPFVLTSEYGFNQIPYLDVDSIWFFSSAIVLLFMIVFSILTFPKRNRIAFCFLYFLITISIGTNFFFDLGAPIAERMLFVPSLAFCLLLATGVFKLFNSNKWSAVIVFCLIVASYSIASANRNSEWKNNETLFFSDIKKSPNSSRLNLFVCEQYLYKVNADSNPSKRSEYLDSALFYCKRSMVIQPNYSFSYLRLGLIWFYKGDYRNAADYWLRARQLDPNNPDGKKWTKELSNWFLVEGDGFNSVGKSDSALNCYDYSLKLDPNNDLILQRKKSLSIFEEETDMN